MSTWRTNPENHREDEDSDATRPPPKGKKRVGHLTMDQLSQLIATAVQQAVKEARPHHEDTSKNIDGTVHEDKTHTNQEEEGHGDSNGESKDLAGQMNELNEEIRQMNSGKGRPFLPKRGSSFSQVIIDEPLPSYFRQVRVGEYDGGSDPGEHLGRFENANMLQCYSDYIKCKVFLTQQWFDQLAPGSITYFQEFSKVFLHQFTSSKRHKKTTLSLFEVKRSEGETLREFVRRFNTAALEVPTCPHEVQISAFTQGLKGEDLFRSLVQRAPATYDELLAQSEKYSNVEEAQRQQRMKKRDRASVERQARPGEKRSGERSYQGRFSQYTPLKVIKKKAVEICQKGELFRKSGRFEEAPKNVPEKYCSFSSAARA